MSVNGEWFEMAGRDAHWIGNAGRSSVQSTAVEGARALAGTRGSVWSHEVRR